MVHRGKHFTTRTSFRVVAVKTVAVGIVIVYRISVLIRVVVRAKLVQIRFPSIEKSAAVGDIHTGLKNWVLRHRLQADGDGNDAGAFVLEPVSRFNRHGKVNVVHLLARILRGAGTRVVVTVGGGDTVGDEVHHVILCFRVRDVVQCTFPVGSCIRETGTDFEVVNIVLDPINAALLEDGDRLSQVLGAVDGGLGGEVEHAHVDGRALQLFNNAFAGFHRLLAAKLPDGGRHVKDQCDVNATPAGKIIIG